MGTSAASMSGFIKIFPRDMSMQLRGQWLNIRIVYIVEQYGKKTGPFRIEGNFHPSTLEEGSDIWEIVANTQPTYNKIFERFFASLKDFLKEYLGHQPVDGLLSGQIKVFELYLPDVYYDYYTHSYERKKYPSFVPKLKAK